MESLFMDLETGLVDTKENWIRDSEIFWSGLNLTKDQIKYKLKSLVKVKKVRCDYGVLFKILKK